MIQASEGGPQRPLGSWSAQRLPSLRLGPGRTEVEREACWPLNFTAGREKHILSVRRCPWLGFLSVRQHPSTWSCSCRHTERRAGPGPPLLPCPPLNASKCNSHIRKQPAAPSTWTKSEYNSLQSGLELPRGSVSTFSFCLQT